MAKVSLRKAMNLTYAGEPSVDQIIEGLQFLKTVKAINQDKTMMTIIDAILLALEAYKLVIQIYEAILAIVPLIERATKIAGAFTNPALISEIVSDIAVQVTNAVTDIVETVKTTAINLVLDTEVEI